MIKIKTPEQIEKMRIAGKMAASVLEMIEPHVQIGITTDTLNTICHNYIVDELQAIPAPLNYKGFPKSICTSINHVICHGIPSDKKLKKSDIINVDITIIKNGFHADTSCMFFVGKPSILAERLVRVTREALFLGIEQVKPGNTLEDVANAIHTHAEKHHYSVVHEYSGHGIGQNFHEAPIVPHFRNSGEHAVFEPGMIFTIEPMINAGRRHMKVLGDGWTSVTRDRSLSAQWEHTILVTEDGYEILTLRKDEIIPVFE